MHHFPRSLSVQHLSKSPPASLNVHPQGPGIKQLKPSNIPILNQRVSPGSPSWINNFQHEPFWSLSWDAQNRSLVLWGILVLPLFPVCTYKSHPPSCSKVFHKLSWKGGAPKIPLWASSIPRGLKTHWTRPDLFLTNTSSQRGRVLPKAPGLTLQINDVCEGEAKEWQRMKVIFFSDYYLHQNQSRKRFHSKVAVKLH